MELQKSEFVFYRNMGVCELVDIETKCLEGDKSVLYYKLKPLADQKSIFYVPVSISDDKLRPVLSKDEVNQIIDSMQQSDDDTFHWSDNRRVRKEMFAKVLKSDDYREGLQMITGLYFTKRSLEKQGKRFSSMNESAIRNAQRLMLEEFGFVLDMNEEDLRRYLDLRVGSQKKLLK